ncbi:MAG: hypothetical protein OHK0052_01340 [Anaerolineales bacterium]
MNTPATPNSRASLELLYHISRELTSALDLRTVLQRVLFLSMRNISASSGSIIVVDEHGQPVESAIIHGAQVHDQTTRQLRVTIDRGLAGWVLKNRQAVLINDTSHDDRWIRRPDDAEERTGPKSAVSAPLLARERLLGVLTLVNPQPGFFTMEHLELVQTIADQAGIAVLNGMLYAESQRQARVMSALAETAAVINATLRVEDVLQRIMVQTTQALRVQAAGLALLVNNGKELEFRAATGWVKDQVIGSRMSVERGVAGWVAREGRGAIIANAQLDPRFDPLTDQRTGFETRALACAPIRLRDRVIGVLEAINPISGGFDSSALMVLSGIGSLAGTAIQHAQLFSGLQAAHRRYRELFEDSIDPIFITNLKGQIIENNRPACLATGLESTVLRERNIRELHQPHSSMLNENLDQVVTGKRNMRYESMLFNAQADQPHPVEVYAHLIEIDEQPYIQWILRDITERKRLDKLRDDLISMIYHDLRSPLNNVISSLDVLQNTLPEESDASTQSILNIAIRSTERIQRLTNSLLDVNRLESGQKIVTQKATAVEGLIADTIDAIAPIAHNKSQEIHSLIQANTPAIYVDADMIRRVLINLLENAAKYTPAHGYLGIGASWGGEWVYLWVEDNGPGIPPEKREQIFHKFARLDEQSEGSTGIGLGLTFCRLVVEGHGGKIWVESQPGLGSRFIFTLPVATSAS